MNIKIHTHQLDMSDPLRTYAEKHIAEAVTTIFSKQATKLDIEFADAVGGREKTCRVSVFVPHGKTLVATAQDPNPYAAVDLAAEKISREIRQYKEKRLAAARKGVSPADLPVGAVVEEMDMDEFEEFEEEAEPLPDPALYGVKPE